MGLQAAEALAHAHQKGVVHRDIKPANLILDSSGDIWITDFGLAHLTDESLTRSQDILGTLRYMAPERLDGGCDSRVDLYSLGTTLYEMLTQRPAFPAADRIQLIHDVRNFSPKPLGKIDSAIPGDLQIIVERAMGREPNRRYQTACSLADDLRRFLAGESILARRASTRERIWDWARRNKRLAASLALSLICLFAVAIGSTIAAVNYRYQRNRAEFFRREGEMREVEGKHRQWEAYLASANGWRHSGGPGQRFEALKAIRSALELPVPPGRTRAELQTEASGALTLSDLQSCQEFPVGTDEDVCGIAPDFSCVAVALANRVIEIRELNPPGVRARLPDIGENNSYTAIRWAPNSQFLAHVAESAPFRCQVWELKPQSHRLLFQREGVNSVDFSPDSGRIALWLNSQRVEIRDLQTQAVTQSIATPTDLTAGFVRWNPRFPQLALNTILLDLGTSNFKRLSLPATQTNDLTWHPDGLELLVCQGDTGLHFWNTQEDRPARPPIQDRKVGGLIAQPNRDGDAVLVSDWSPGWRLFDVASGALLIRNFVDGSVVLAFSPDQSLLGVDMTPGRGQLFRLHLRNEFRSILVGDELLNGHILSAGGKFAVSGDERFAAVQSWDQATRFVDLENRTWSNALEIPGRVIGFLANGNCLTIGSMGLVEWEVNRSGNRVQIGGPRLLSSDPNIADAAIHNPSGLIALARYDQPTIMARLNGSDLKLLFEGAPQSDVRHVSLSPDGKLLASGSHGNDPGYCLRIVDATVGDQVIEFANIPINGLVFSPDSNWLLAPGPTPHLWRTSDWQEPYSALLPKDALAGCFSHDGRLLALQDTPGHVLVIDLQKGESLARLALPEKSVFRPLRLASDGRLILQEDSTNRLAILDLQLVHEELNELNLAWQDRAYFPNTRSDSPPLSFQNKESDLQRQWSFETRLITARRHRSAGRFGAAIATFRQLVNGSGANAELLDEFAWLLVTAPLEFRNPQESRALAEQAADLAPESASIWNTLGVARYRCGQFPESIEALLKSRSLNHPQAEYNYYFLSLCAARLGKTKESRQWLNQAETLVEKNATDDPALALERKHIRDEAFSLIGHSTLPDNQKD